jgi:hypothetical protein
MSDLLVQDFPLSQVPPQRRGEENPGKPRTSIIDRAGTVRPRRPDTGSGYAKSQQQCRMIFRTR